MTEILYNSKHDIQRFSSDQKEMEANCTSIAFINEHATDYVRIYFGGSYKKLNPNGGHMSINNNPDTKEVSKFKIVFQNSGTGELVIMYQNITPVR